MTTKPIASWGKFLNQRIRWASNTKWQIFLNREFFIYLVAVFGTVILPIVLLFFHFQIAAFIIFLRIILELLFIYRTTIYFRIEKRKFNFYPIWFLIQPIYILVVSLLGQLGVFRWK